MGFKFYNNNANIIMMLIFLIELIKPENLAHILIIIQKKILMSVFLL